MFHYRTNFNFSPHTSTYINTNKWRIYYQTQFRANKCINNVPIIQTTTAAESKTRNPSRAWTCRRWLLGFHPLTSNIFKVLIRWPENSSVDGFDLHCVMILFVRDAGLFSTCFSWIPETVWYLGSFFFVFVPRCFSLSLSFSLILSLHSSSLVIYKCISID